jgi:hypothetical protein
MNVLTNVRTLIDEVTPVFWADQQVYDAINECQLIAQLVPGLAVAETSFTVGVSDEFVSLPAEVMVPLEIISAESLEPCWITSQVKLEQYNREWKRREAAEPKWFVVWDVFHLRPYPKADKQYTFKLKYIPYPSVEIADGVEDLPNTPDLLKESIVARAAGKLMVATMPQFAFAQFKSAKEYEERFRRRIRNQQGHRIYHLRPGGKVSRDKTGVIRSAQWCV